MTPFTPSKGFAVAAIVLAAGSSHALVAYNNFGAGDSFSTGSSLLISSNYWDGFRFTSQSSGMLDKVTIPVSAMLGSTFVSVNLCHDSGGALGMGMIGWAYGTSGLVGTPYAPQVLNNSSPSISLVAGQSYWLVVQTLDGDKAAFWNFNNTGASGAMASGGMGSPWTYEADYLQGAFRVETVGSSVPGPAAFAPFALGLVGLLRRKRR
jgi:MYXO-CTERM domain-containing protein